MPLNVESPSALNPRIRPYVVGTSTCSLFSTSANARLDEAPKAQANAAVPVETNSRRVNMLDEGPKYRRMSSFSLSFHTTSRNGHKTTCAWQASARFGTVSQGC